MHCREDVAIACFSCQRNPSCRAIVIDFCIGKASTHTSESPSCNEHAPDTLPDRNVFTLDDARSSLSTAESRFLSRIFSANMRPLIDIAKDIFSFFFISRTVE